MFSQTSRYALSALTLLARRPGEIVSAAELADALDLPANYLSKTFDRLRAEGLVEAVRGRGGGFRLALPPAKVTLARVVGAFEPVDGARRCLLGKGTCGDVGGCPAHHAWKAASAPVFRFLETNTLADLASDRAAWPPVPSLTDPSRSLPPEALA